MEEGRDGLKCCCFQFHFCLDMSMIQFWVIPLLDPVITNSISTASEDTIDNQMYRPGTGLSLMYWSCFIPGRIKKQMKTRENL